MVIGNVNAHWQKRAEGTKESTLTTGIGCVRFTGDMDTTTCTIAWSVSTGNNSKTCDMQQALSHFNSAQEQAARCRKVPLKVLAEGQVEATKVEQEGMLIQATYKCFGYTASVKLQCWHGPAYVNRSLKLWSAWWNVRVQHSHTSSAGDLQACYFLKLI